MNALCDCISNSIRNPPDYRIGNVCGSWVDKMIDCANIRNKPM